MTIRANHRPLVYKLLLFTCVLLAGYLIFVLVNSLLASQNSTMAVIQLLLWVGIGTGFWRTQKWAWAAFDVIMLFSLLSIVYTILTQRMPVNIFVFLSIAMIAMILWGLNLPSVRTHFRIDTRQGKPLARAVRTFAVFSLTAGLFIVFQLLGTGRVTAGSVPVRLFLAMLAGVHIILGLGIWHIKSHAVQAALPVLLFTAISVAIILVYDFMNDPGFLAVRKALYYLFISGGMLWYWVRVTAPQLSETD
jgi:hypothetical protein